MKVGAKAAGFSGIAMASSDPTSNEFIEHYAFQFGNQQIKGSNINIVQEGLFEVNDSNASVEYVESALNTAYNGVSILLKDYNLGTKKGRLEASRFIYDNQDIIRYLINTLWQDSQKEDEEDK